jgi:phosphatidyl-myo-inositol dimannoside synthase
MPRRPRVLVITPDFPPATGGIQLLVHRVVGRFVDHEARVLTLPTPGCRAFDARAGVAVTRARNLGPGRHAAVASLNVRGLAVAARFRPDVILSAHIVGSPSAAAIRRVSGVPFVQYLYAKEVGARPALASFAVRHADACIAVSRHTESLAIRAGASPRRIYRIPPGVDAPLEVGEARFKRPTIVTVSRLDDRHKGHDVLVRALPLIAARVPGVRWVVIGQGPLRAHIERLSKVAGLNGSVEFVGEVSDAERDRCLARSHVFTMPSRLPRSGDGGEGFGIAYVEAGRHRVPVVAGNVGGSLDAVVDGETGLLVDPTDPVAVAEAVCAILTDSRLAQRLGEGGAARAQEFRWELTAASVENVLRTVRGRRAEVAVRPDPSSIFR